jgi:hypothetical protein
VNAQVTQYGLGTAAGGWDGASDSFSDQWIGDRNNTLNMSSCALSPLAEKQLGVKGGELLKIYFDAKHIYYRTFDDRTSQDITNARVDFFFPYAFDKTVPSFPATVTLA